MTAAEVYFAAFIAEHNLPFLAADHFSKLCKVMFPDRDIAKRFSSGQTKITALVKHAMTPTFNNQVISACKSSPFSVLCDGGNDQMDRKFFAIMVCYWNQAQRQADTRICNVATAEALFQGAVTPIDAVVSAATGVTICDRRKNAVTL